MENSNDIIGNRNRDLPACSSVPQPAASPRPQSIKVHGPVSEKNCNMNTIDLVGTPPHRHNRTNDTDFQLETPLVHRNTGLLVTLITVRTSLCYKRNLIP